MCVCVCVDLARMSDHEMSIMRVRWICCKEKNTQSDDTELSFALKFGRLHCRPYETVQFGVFWSFCACTRTYQDQGCSSFPGLGKTRGYLPSFPNSVWECGFRQLCGAAFPRNRSYRITDVPIETWERGGRQD